MNTITAVSNRVLEVDLTTGRVGQIVISDTDRRKYLGGKGLALKLLYDAMGPGVDPLSPDNALVAMTGPTAGTAAPAGGRFAVAGKSPHTGIFGSSVVGGSFGVSLKRSGYDGIVIRGAAEKPVYIQVDEGKVSINDASGLWGMDTYEVQDAQADKGDWMVIGPAGENLVSYAAIVAGRRVAGRCGFGAVMGSKKLKGIVAKGGGEVKAGDPEGFRKAVEVARKKIKAHPITASALPSLGTAHSVMLYGPVGMMPVRNFSRAKFDRIDDIRGETIREKHTVRRHGCIGCPIQCGHMGKFGDAELVNPEYETLVLMGSNLEISDVCDIARWNDLLNRLGLDSISTGNTIGFAMELAERGLFPNPLRFGHADGISEVVGDIACRRGLGNDLAGGVRRLSEKYGGKEFANHVKGLEMPAYDPRGATGQGLGFATANRGACHLSGSTHAVEVTYLDQYDWKGKARFCRFLQDVFEAVNSSIFCNQTQNSYLEDPENPMLKFMPPGVQSFLMRNFTPLAIATIDLSTYTDMLSGLFGYPVSGKDFYAIGERVFNLERHMNVREGITRADDTLPPRILDGVREDGRKPIRPVFEKMLDQYYRLRGWDRDGKPARKTMERLGIRT